ncbi:MAG: phosphatidylserine decarboxylase [Acidobacteriota bacterium]
MLPFAPEGYPFVLVPATAGIAAFLFGYPVVAWLLWGFAVFCVTFFRDPARSSDAPPEAVLAPADGKVLSVGNAPSPLAAQGLPTQVSIFMSPANVHVNRAPISGVASEVLTRPGRKFPAYRDKASELNEHSFVRIDGPAASVAYKQIAGSVARRVVCDLTPGEDVTRGQRVGIIKLSSRVDLFLPGHVKILVAPGDRTRAGETVVAVISDGPQP